MCVQNKHASITQLSCFGGGMSSGVFLLYISTTYILQVVSSPCFTFVSIDNDQKVGSKTWGRKSADISGIFALKSEQKQLLLTYYCL